MSDKQKRTRAFAFVCPYCKGRGSWVEPVTDDGWGPTEHCGLCSGNGMIEPGSDDHRQLLSLSVSRWLNARFVRKGDDWDADPKWAPVWNAANRLTNAAAQMLLDAKMEHYHGSDDPKAIKVRDEAASTLEADTQLVEETQKHNRTINRILAACRESPAHELAMADRYGGIYEEKALVLLAGAGLDPDGYGLPRAAITHSEPLGKDRQLIQHSGPSQNLSEGTMGETRTRTRTLKPLLDPRASDEQIGALTQAARDCARNGEGPAVTAAVDAVCCAVEQLADEVFRMRATYDGMLGVSRSESEQAADLDAAKGARP